MPTKTGRWEIRCTDDLKARVIEEAGRRGQTLTAFMERALEASLAGASEATGGHTGDPAGQGLALADPGAPPTRPPSSRRRPPAGRALEAGPSTKTEAGEDARVSPRRPAASPRTQPGRVHSQRCTCAVCKPPKGKR